MTSDNLIQQLGALAIQIKQTETELKKQQDQYAQLNAQAVLLQELESSGYTLTLTKELTKEQTKKGD